MKSKHLKKKYCVFCNVEMKSIYYYNCSICSYSINSNYDHYTESILLDYNNYYIEILLINNNKNNYIKNIIIKKNLIKIYDNEYQYDNFKLLKKYLDSNLDKLFTDNQFNNDIFIDGKFNSNYKQNIVDIINLYEKLVSIS